jgi:serine/threonine protein phosphatase PrpC
MSYYAHKAASLVDTGVRRASNQDEVLMCPDLNFYAVSDGMGGLTNGGKTSGMVKEALPLMIRQAVAKPKKNIPPAYAANLLKKQVRLLSDTIYNTANKGHRFNFGSTLSGVWLVGLHAIFVNIGDSRSYLLPRLKRIIEQVSEDHNVAALLVKTGELTKEEARNHPSSSQLTRFIGMTSPALPDVFIRKIAPGDRILLCSDGLYGMVDDAFFPRIMRSSRKLDSVCEQLIDAANKNGGCDNISAVYIKITG